MSATAERTEVEEFVAFFAEGWRIGATDPERFFALFGARITPDALLTQPLAAPSRGPEGLRELFAPAVRGDARPRRGGPPLGRHRGRRADRAQAARHARRQAARPGRRSTGSSCATACSPSATPTSTRCRCCGAAQTAAGRREAAARAARKGGDDERRGGAPGATPRSDEARASTCAQGRLQPSRPATGPPIVFVHGLLVNANLWRKVVPQLVAGLPLHRARPAARLAPLPMNENADLGRTALADLIADAIEALGLEDVTLVGNDTGGALCQIVVTRRPERIGRLVLTSCDYRDNFPPPMFAYFKPAARIPGAFSVLLAPMRFRAPRQAAVRVRLAGQAARSTARRRTRTCSPRWTNPGVARRREEGGARPRQAATRTRRPTGSASSASRR